MNEPEIICITYLASSPSEVWDALTNPDLTQRYWFGTRIESDWKPGSKGGTCAPAPLPTNTRSSALNLCAN